MNNNDQKYTLSGNLGEIVNKLNGTIQQYPRHVHGYLLIDRVPFAYVDLHSFYHQTIQIFGNRLYGFTTANPSPLIIDCGAHVGLASLYFKQSYPESRIIAFEADPKIADLCRENLSNFGAQNVEVRAQAVWTSAGEVNFDFSNDDSGAVCDLKTSSNKIPAAHFRKILSECGEIDLVKMDIEGAEFSVIPDCRGALRNAKNYIIEAHIFQQPAQLGAILNALESEGFNYTLSDLHQADWIQPAEKPPFHECRTSKFLVTIFAWRKD